MSDGWFYVIAFVLCLHTWHGSPLGGFMECIIEMKFHKLLLDAYKYIYKLNLHIVMILTFVYSYYSCIIDMTILCPGSYDLVWEFLQVIKLVPSFIHISPPIQTHMISHTPNLKSGYTEKHNGPI
jgi:hypothetical protein